ncbi:ankyrin repeat domain-containing protein, partial [Acinetobacter baumannii]
VRSGEDQVLGVLLSNGVSADARAQDGEPAIVAAARAGRTNIVRMLASAHANPGLQDRSGTSALMVAAAAPNPEMLQV